MIFQDIYTRLRYRIASIGKGIKERFLAQRQRSQSSVEGVISSQHAATTMLFPTFGAATAKETRQASGASATTTGTLLLLTAM